MSSSTRNSWCDCIRGYAILLVCLSHLLYVAPVHSHLGFLISYLKGDTGVFLFYVLSGFLVTGILEREVSDQATAGQRFRGVRNFFARRVFRLQPSHLLFLGCYALLPAQFGALPWWTLVFPLSNWFAGPYITWHLKTLHIEETYYAAIGLLCLLFRRRLRFLLWFGLVLAPIGRILLFAAMKLGSETARLLGERYLPIEAFAIGGLLSLYLAELSTTRVAAVISRRPAVSFMFALVGLLVTGALRPIKPFSYALLLTWPLLFSLFSAIAIYVGLREQRFPFSARWLRLLGLASYTVYLFQQFALGPWDQTFASAFFISRWLVVLLGTALLVPIWYGFAEKPLTDLGARLFPRTAYSPSREKNAAANLAALPLRTEPDHEAKPAT
jgi:peptidoglycan/LPS O-acetylase OafA/YrhL